MKRAVKKHPLSHISFHPLIQSLPRWADDSEDLLGLAADIRERGIDQPLICSRTSGGKGETGVLYLLDGRHRFFGAQMGGLKAVPVIVRQETEAQGIVLNSLAQRRHYTKGALAYLSYPVIVGNHCGHGGERGNQWNKRVATSTERTLIQSAEEKESSTERTILQKSASTERTLIQSAEEIAEKLGFGRTLFFQARELHKRFDEHPELKEQFEPRVLSGEIGLGACIAGIGGKIATEDKKIGQTEMSSLLREAFKAVVIRVNRDWQSLSRPQRLGIAQTTVELILNKWPNELHEALYESLKEKAKGAKS